MQKIRPLGDRVIVRREEEEKVSKGGILIPDSAKEKPQMGTVVSVGPGVYLENGDRRAIDLKKGDRVVFGKYSGTEVKISDEDLLVLREEDIMGVIEG